MTASRANLLMEIPLIDTNMRLFIAVNFNRETNNSLLTLRDELRSGAEHGSFTLSDNLHITLAFLGECNAKQAFAAKTVMDSVSFKPFDILVERVGRFGGAEGEALWWAGVSVDETLSDLHRILTDKLVAAGFKLDSRKFSPHITLGRRVVTDAVPRRITPFGETVHKIDLMKSERINGKLTYTAIHKRISC